MKKSGGKAVRYNKWGYIFLVPFIVVYVIFQLIPLFSTIYNSFFENYMSGTDTGWSLKFCRITELQNLDQPVSVLTYNSQKSCYKWY